MKIMAGWGKSYRGRSWHSHETVKIKPTLYFKPEVIEKLKEAVKKRRSLAEFIEEAVIEKLGLKEKS